MYQSHTILKRFVLLAVLCLIPASMVMANMLFFTSVMKNCQHYKVSGDQIQFHLEGGGTDNLEFHLTLPSRRNNFEEVIMAGYLSTAYAIKRTGLKVKTVYVSVVIPSAGNELKATKADASLLARLVAQTIDPHKFLGEVEWLN